MVIIRKICILDERGLSSKPMTAEFESYSITFGDRAEHDFRSEKHGELAERGIPVSALRAIMETVGTEHCTHANLSMPLSEHLTPEQADEWKRRYFKSEADSHSGKIYVASKNEASVLVIRGGVDLVAGEGTADAMLKEQQGVTYTTKGIMYGKLRNKLARHTLVFGPSSVPCTLAEDEDGHGIGTGATISFDEVPALHKLRNALMALLNSHGVIIADLRGEGNKYYSKECGIGFHGDAERRITVCAKLGSTMPIVFQWYYRGAPVGPPAAVLNINHGDLYFMSERATGTNWRSEWLHLRHASGSKKYITPK